MVTFILCVVLGMNVIVDKEPPACHFVTHLAVVICRCTFADVLLILCLLLNFTFVYQFI